MIILLDVHLPPSLAQWIEDEVKMECRSFESLHWLTLDDGECVRKSKIHECNCNDKR
jgi:hypothetical protein